VSKMTDGQARAIEEALIVRNRGQNIIYSISPRHRYYKDALEWGEMWLKINGMDK